MLVSWTHTTVVNIVIILLSSIPLCHSQVVCGDFFFLSFVCRWWMVWCRRSACWVPVCVCVFSAYEYKKHMKGNSSTCAKWDGLSRNSTIKFQFHMYNTNRFYIVCRLIWRYFEAKSNKQWNLAWTRFGMLRVACLVSVRASVFISFLSPSLAFVDVVVIVDVVGSVFLSRFFLNNKYRCRFC